ncbi:hypothetical protein KC19_9G186900 [Ceratodon purpureus]|uniref:Secreted protein n=1 Tax=Ceratodon purpureus TaxID=3225 RepID=A0A8T0GXI1_CERPU|nr:hypothetical protein KC19_9G186900 [Ceratodon purpureus]
MFRVLAFSCGSVLGLCIALEIIQEISCNALHINCILRSSSWASFCHVARGVFIVRKTLWHEHQ